jgi:pimeloyl-ACP methyl ester carboxylesterase
MNAPFPIEAPEGYLDFHPNANINYQFNRWLPFLRETELRDAAARIDGVASFVPVMLSCAQRAEAEDRVLNAAFYYRAAEFFALSGDPRKAEAYGKFRDLFAQVLPSEGIVRVDVPFENGALPSLVVEPAQGAPVDTLVVHGGFDSFVEELYPHVVECVRHGFRLIMFEGPGQGAALTVHGLKMTPDWHLPVKAVLDFHGVESCTLMGISLGGCLATRAAAFEPRIKRVIANDVCEDFFDVLSSRLGPGRARLLGWLMRNRFDGTVNRMLGMAARKEETLGWAIAHGLHVSGTATPCDYLRWAQTLTTRDISDRVTQDYLLLGAADDHLIPRAQYYSQQQTLTNVRSLTARLFTAREQAGQHCHVGNTRLSVEVIVNWILETKRLRDAAGDA